MGYLLVALLALRGGGCDRVPGEGVDLYGTLWFYGWVRHCVESLASPWHTRAFFHPDGMDVLAATGGNLLDAVLSVPFQWALGPTGWALPFFAFVLMGNGWAVHHMVQKRGGSVGASLAAALAFELHPYFLFELGQGRPTQVVAWFLPLAMGHLLAMVDRPTWRDVLWAGAWLAAQGWTWWFWGHLAAVVLGPVLVILAMGRPGWRSLAALGAALGLALLLATPALLPMMERASAGALPGLSGPAFGASHGPDPRTTFAAWWVLDPGASGSGIGLGPWLVLLAAVALSRRPLEWSVGALSGTLLLAGPVLAWGTWARGNPLWALAQGLLPFFGRFWYPYRAWGVLALVLALALAEAWDRWAPRRGWRAAVGLVGLGLVAGGAALLEPVPATRIQIPAYVARVKEAPGPVLDLPFLCAGEAIHLQPLHGQPLVGGMAEESAALRPLGVQERVMRDPLLGQVARVARGAKAGGSARLLPLPETDVRWIVLHRDLLERMATVPGCGLGPPDLSPAVEVLSGLVALLGPPTVEDPWAVAWDLRRGQPDP